MYDLYWGQDIGTIDFSDLLFILIDCFNFMHAHAVCKRIHIVYS
jgi:hypothetical protein